MDNTVLFGIYVIFPTELCTLLQNNIGIKQGPYTQTNVQRPHFQHFFVELI